MFVTTDKRHNALTKNSIAHSNNTKHTNSTENTNFSSLMMLILRIWDLLRHRDPGLKIKNLKVSSNSLIHSFQTRFKLFWHNFLWIIGPPLLCWSGINPYSQLPTMEGLYFQTPIPLPPSSMEIPVI